MFLFTLEDEAEFLLARGYRKQFHREYRAIVRVLIFVSVVVDEAVHHALRVVLQSSSLRMASDDTCVKEQDRRAISGVGGVPTDGTSFEQRGDINVVPLKMIIADTEVGDVVEELLDAQLTLSLLR